MIPSTTRPAGGRPRGSSRYLAFAVIVSLLLGGPGSPVVVFAQSQPERFARVEETVERFDRSLEEMRAGLDPSSYDVDALALEVAFDDAETITARLHDRLAYEPYRGVLRGLTGTVASGAGNALDQALVLARLLNDAGYEAEIRRAELDDERARDVLRQVRLDPAAERTMAVDPAGALPGLSDEVIATLRSEEERITADLLADAARAEAQLLDLVELEGGANEDLLDLARDYFWVTYRWSEGEDWQPAHPVFGETPAAFVSLTAEEAFGSEIPADLQHRVRVQAFLERKIGDELEVVPIMAAWERPAANLYGVSRTFSVVPDGLEAVDDPTDTEALTEATSFFFPIFGGALADGGMAFDLNGNVVPPDAAASPMAGVFGEVGESVSEAAGALGALGSDAPAEDPQALTGVWLEFTVIDPSGTETVHRRMIVDRLGSAARAAGTAQLRVGETDVAVVEDLVGAHTFMADTGVYRGQYVMARSLEAFEAVSDYLQEVLTAMRAGERPPAYGQEVAASEEPLGPLHLFQAFAAHPRGEDVRSYRTGPGLVVMSGRMAGNRAQVDIVANPRMALRVGGDLPTPAPAAALRAGVWETRAEILPLLGDGEPVSPPYRALEAGELAVVRDPADVAALDLAAESTEAMHEDLDRGYLVVAPARGPSRDVVAGWWRIDPRSGETLGRGGDGRGQSFTEYLTSFEVSTAISAGFTVYGVNECTKIEDPAVAGCCIVQNVALAAAGAGVGAGAALALNTAENLGMAIRVFAALDIYGNLLATQVDLCSA